ncbi:FAD/NAD(P)-binding protein [Leuconostoc pseudomesenteroides]|uniref:FAD/NAD(P)-binding protein n=1 Tax=Leuconostoc pseudomesenteroides TaxID=33968 RepID=UPI001121442F|nr:FAD/NAD(P)-binding protein [Leuconostoc pseudomesenteroides]TOZ06714.1 FAD-dependent oxidoreductase [Leuconostoc pseudomesenteroides]
MQVAIIGAGPRGLAVAERLINLDDSDNQLDVQIFDPYAIGGRVWDPTIKQNNLFLMNTVIDQVTLFNDDSIENGGKPFSGPSLFQWLTTEASDFIAQHPEFDSAYANEILQLTHTGDFATRGIMGIYAAWFFEWLKRRGKSNQTLNYTKQTVADLVKIGTKFQVTLGDGTQILADQVVMALGHADDELTPEEVDFKAFADENHLPYIGPTHPSEADLSGLTENNRVIIRGLGLSFFDYLAALSIGKGGTFVRDDSGELIYQPSGHEPHIIAGSRGGFPLHARGVNEKDASELYQPTFFTLPALDALRAAGDGKMSYEAFESLVVKELTYKHLLNRINSGQSNLTYDQSEALKVALLTSGDLNATAAEFGLSDIPSLDIDLVRNPARDLPNDADYRTWLLSYLAADIADARLGNKSAPFAGAFDILRDMRDRVRYVVEHDYFSVDDYEKFLTKFRPLDVLVSVGPPLLRVEQLRALIKAGIVDITASQIKVTTEDGQFVARDSRQQEYRGNALVEARLGATNMAIAVNPILVNLRDKGTLVSPTLMRQDGTSWTLGAANIDRQTLEVIDANGDHIPNLYLYGIPVEGKKWFGTVIPRPGVNTVILREGAVIAQRILENL